MDAVTALIRSVQNPYLTSLGNLIANPFVLFVLLIGLIVIFEKKNDIRIKIFASLTVAFVLSLVMKYLNTTTCSGSSWCLFDDSFPSTHASLVFTLLLCFMNKKSFPIFVIFALVVSFVMVNIGAHTFPDIVGAVPVALVAYYLTNFVWAGLEKKGILAHTSN
jgi:membrane-associated phospholipid phosphatase